MDLASINYFQYPPRMDKEPVICARPTIDGTHYPTGIFAAAGPGIRQGVELPEMQIPEVAPAVLYSLDMDIPSNFEAPVPVAVFEESHVPASPPTIGAPTLPPLTALGQDGKVVQLEAEEEEQLIKQMQALGYME